MLEKLEIDETSDYEEIENKKDEDKNKEISNKDETDQKKESKFDENQEMAIDTSMTELENLADENDKDSNEIEVEDTSNDSKKEREVKIILEIKNTNFTLKNLMKSLSLRILSQKKNCLG